MGKPLKQLTSIIGTIQRALAASSDIFAVLDEPVEEELGDLLFAVVNLARHLEVCAEDALRAATRRFEARFRRVEELAQGDLRDLDLAALDALWERAKAEER